MWGAQTLMMTRCLFITGKKRAQRRTQARAALKAKKEDGVDEGFLFTPPPGRSAHHLGRRASQHQNRGPGSLSMFTDGVVTNEKDDRPFGSGWARRAVLCRVSLSKLAVSRPAATVRMGGFPELFVGLMVVAGVSGRFKVDMELGPRPKTVERAYKGKSDGALQRGFWCPQRSS